MCGRESKSFLEGRRGGDALEISLGTLVTGGGGSEVY